MPKELDHGPSELCLSSLHHTFPLSVSSLFPLSFILSFFLLPSLLLFLPFFYQATRKRDRSESKSPKSNLVLFCLFQLTAGSFLAKILCLLEQTEHYQVLWKESPNPALAQALLTSSPAPKPASVQLPGRPLTQGFHCFYNKHSWCTFH